MKQPLIELPGHQLYRPITPASHTTVKCTCGWQATRPADAALVDDWHAHLDDVIRRHGREP